MPDKKPVVPFLLVPVFPRSQAIEVNFASPDIRQLRALAAAKLPSRKVLSTRPSFVLCMEVQNQDERDVDSRSRYQVRFGISKYSHLHEEILVSSPAAPF